jgi:hypothetical protein
VIYEGRIMGVLNAHEATVEQLGLMMSGTPMERLVETMEGSRA